MTAELSFALTLVIVLSGGGLIWLTSRGNLQAGDSLRRQVSDLTDKVMILERTNRALQEALAVVQAELGDTRQVLQTERESRQQLHAELAVLQQELAVYRARLGLGPGLGMIGGKS